MVSSIRFKLACAKGNIEISVHIQVVWSETEEVLQFCSQNNEKVTHIRGRLLYQALILYNYVTFQIGTSLKGKNLLSLGANYFLSVQFLVVREITFP